LKSFYIHFYVASLVYLQDRVLEVVSHYVILLASAEFLSRGCFHFALPPTSMRVPVSQKIHQQS